MLIHTWFWFFWNRSMKAFRRKRSLKFKCKGSRMYGGIFSLSLENWCRILKFSPSPSCPMERLREGPQRVFHEKASFQIHSQCKEMQSQWNSHCPFFILENGRGGVAGEQSAGSATLGWRSHWPCSTRTNVILSRTSVHSLGLLLRSTRKWGRPENNRVIISCISGDLKSEIEMLVGLVLPREGASCPSLCSWWSLAIPVLHWLIDASPPCLPPASHGCLPSVCVCMAICLLIRTPALNEGSSDPVWAHVHLTASAWPYFKMRPHSQIWRVESCTHLFKEQLNPQDVTEE